MDIQTFSRIKSKFVAREVADELVIVPLSGNVAQMNELFTLNETARFIWEQTDETASIDTLAVKMTETFDIDEETAKTDIESFLKKMDILSVYSH
jgi:hypothetical protein